MFRSTSKTFRDRLPSPFPSVFPLQVPQLNSLSTDPRMNFYLIQHTGFLIKTKPHPIILVFETKFDAAGPLFFPLRLFGSDSSIETTWTPPGNIDVKILRLSEVFKTYYLHYRSKAFTKYLGENYSVQKIVLVSYFSNTNQCISNINPKFAVDEDGVDLCAVVLLKDGRLTHVSLNSKDASKEWEFIVSPSKFEDVVNFRGRLWAVDVDGGGHVLDDYNSMQMSQVVDSPMAFIDNITRDSWLEGRKRLVESSGKLYMLFPCSDIKDETVAKILVFELSSKVAGRGTYEWVEVESIGNRAFVVGHGFSFSVEIDRDLSDEVKGNSIYLNGLSFDRYAVSSKKYPFFVEMQRPGPSFGVYSLMDKKFSNVLPDDCPLIYCNMHCEADGLTLDLVKQRKKLTLNLA